MGINQLPFRARCLGALLAGATGDAVGERIMQGTPIADAQPLRYTDDTAMALTLGEHLAAGYPCEPEAVGSALAAEYHREPWRGYGPDPPAVFQRVAGGRPVLRGGRGRALRRPGVVGQWCRHARRPGGPGLPQPR